MAKAKWKLSDREWFIQEIFPCLGLAEYRSKLREDPRWENFFQAFRIVSLVAIRRDIIPRASKLIAQGAEVIYLSGPYSGKTPEEIDANIAEAEQIAAELWLKGFTCLCPHKNTAHFERICPQIPYERYMEGDLLLVERSDAMVMMPKWRASKGAPRERAHALQLGIPVYEYPNLPPLPEKLK